jgi:uncharacterized protein with HEPN domain
MREQRNDPKRLKDILQAIDTVNQYVDGRDMEVFNLFIPIYQSQPFSIP